MNQEYLSRQTGVSVLLSVFVLIATGLLATSVQAGTIGGGDLGRCERLDSESTQVCTGKGKNMVCVSEDTHCGMYMQNVEHNDAKMSYIHYMGQ